MTTSVLVTGGAGYVGSHACKALARAGYRPVTYDDLRAGHREAVRWGPLVEADVGDHARLVEALRKYDVGAVMHFAGSTSVAVSMVDPAGYFRNNVAASLVLLEAMRACEVGAIIFSSSAAVYGVPERSPIAEDDPKQPVNPYGESKLMMERMLAWCGTAYGLAHGSFRYFNAAGADPECEIGEDHNPEHHLIPLVLDVALGRRAAIDVYGCDYPTPDGTAVRDYVHVRDLAEAHVAGLQRLLAGGDSFRLNLGTGQGLSVREAIAAVERVTGRPVPQRSASRRPGDPPALVADPTRARATLSWTPHLSDIDTIIRTAFAHRAQLTAASAG
jgi:UDP-glucose-4-epimerase GalE